MARQKKKVLMVDLDQQDSMTKAAGFRLDRNAPHIGDLLTDTEGKVTWEQTILTGTNEHLHLIPSTMTLVRHEMYLNSERGTDHRLADLLSKHATGYDYIFLDCPPNTGIMTFRALAAADYYIVPMQGETFAYDGLDSTHNIVNLVKRNVNTKLQLAGVVLNKCEGNTILGRTILEVMTNQKDLRIFSTRIRKDVNLAEAQNERESIFDRDPKSRGAIDMKSLADELGRIIEEDHQLITNA